LRPLSIRPSGGLRAPAQGITGGDTAFCFWLDTCSVWLVGVVSVYLALFVFKAPFWIVAICLVLEEAVKAVVGFARFRSQKWLNDLVN